jgi:secernin
MFLTKKIILIILILFLMPGMLKDITACDTWVALKDAVGDGFIILGKNSDRPLFGCQPLVFYPRAKWEPGSKVNLGRIAIPQVRETYATMGSSPYWCWGYEEGINEYGVAIGNEGVITKVLAEEIAALQEGKGPKLGPTGMDLIRLALERAKTAREALTVITTLTEIYGQFGSGTPTMDIIGAYHNSYIIADPKEAWVLEIAGKQWAAKKFQQGSTSISNTLSIDTKWDLASREMVKYAIEKGWWPHVKQKSFSFRGAYNDDSQVNIDKTQRALTRALRSRELLREKKGQIDTRWMMRIARDRTTLPSIDLNQTASSCVAVLPDKKEHLPVFWWCPAVPSSSCYVPFFVHGSKLPEIVSTAGTYGKVVEPPGKVKQDSFSLHSYWWLFRDLADLVNDHREKRVSIVRKEFDALEKEFEAAVNGVIKKAVKLHKAGQNDEAAKVLDEFSAACIEKVVKKVNQLREQFKKEVVSIPEKYKPYVGIYIANFGTFKNDKFKVKVVNGHLAVDIPGRIVMELKDPDDESLWYFKLANTVAFSFSRDKRGKVNAMYLHQTNLLSKKTTEQGEAVEKAQKDVEEKYRPYVGQYIDYKGEVIFKALVQGGKLVLDYRGKEIIQLNSPDNKGRWYFSQDKNAAVSFIRDNAGAVKSLKLQQKIEILRDKL